MNMSADISARKVSILDIIYSTISLSSNYVNTSLYSMVRSDNEKYKAKKKSDHQEYLQIMNALTKAITSEIDKEKAAIRGPILIDNSESAIYKNMRNKAMQIEKYNQPPGYALNTIKSMGPMDDKFNLWISKNNKESEWPMNINDEYDPSPKYNKSINNNEDQLLNFNYKRINESRANSDLLSNDDIEVMDTLRMINKHKTKTNKPILDDKDVKVYIYNL